MEAPVSLSLSPLQAMLIFAVWSWILIAPVLILRKLDRLTALLEDYLAGDGEE